MLAGPILFIMREAGEFGEFRQRDVHAESPAARLEALDAACEVRRQIAGVHHPFVEQFRADIGDHARGGDFRSEEHTSELQSLMRNSYAVFCLKKKTINQTQERTSRTVTI